MLPFSSHATISYFVPDGVKKKKIKEADWEQAISVNRCHGYLQIKTIKAIKFIKVDQRES